MKVVRRDYPSGAGRDKLSGLLREYSLREQSNTHGACFLLFEE
jgi:hypothetical protein